MICVQHHPQPLPVYSRAQSGKVEISRIVKPKDEEVSPSLPTVQPAARSASLPVTVAPTAVAEPKLTSTTGTVPTKRQSANVTHPAESPAKKQSKWSQEEDTKIIGLRGEGMKWEDISKHLPGRSAISCRLHYQNYLERRSEWDEDRKNKLARLYERFKADMWSKIAEEMSIPWRAAEAMHWQMGEEQMARRAGVTPFSMNPNSGLPYVPLTTLPPRSHMRSNSAAPRPRDQSMRQVPQQLPSVAELTSGLPAYSTLPAPMCYPRTSSSDFYHHTSTGPRR